MAAATLFRPAFIAVFLALSVFGPALGQAPPPPSAVAPGSDLDKLTQVIDGASAVGTALRSDKTLPDTLQKPVDDLNGQLGQARQLVQRVASGADERDTAIFRLLGLTGIFLVLSAGALAFLAIRVQGTFWAEAAKKDPPDDTWRSYLMQLPLGAPEGSIRALISFYVIIFGLLVLILQDQLGLRNVEVIAGFIGIVITFYFTAHTTDQATRAVRTAVDAANKATAQVQDTTRATQDQITQAVGAVSEATKTAQVAATAAQQATSQAGAAASGPDPQIVTAQSGLQTVKDGLQTASQVIGALGSLGVGTGLVADAGALTKTASGLLDAIDPLLSGSPSVANIGEVIGKAQTALDGLDNAGLPGVLGDAIAGISGTLGALSPIISGISGGPAGIVFGIVMSGIKLLQQKEKFDTWKAALLRTPMTRALMPATVDGTAALAALDPAVSPLMAARIGTVPPAFATELMRAMLQTGPSGDPLPADALATELFAPGQELGLHDKFKDEKELAEAITEYRAGIVFVNARSQLQGNIDIPAGGGQPASSINLGSLLTSAVKLSADPRSAADVERLVYVVEALGKLGLGPDKLVGLAQAALTKGMDLSQINRQQADQQQ